MPQLRGYCLRQWLQAPPEVVAVFEAPEADLRNSATVVRRQWRFPTKLNALLLRADVASSASSG
ncbi:hypothetical protein KCP78_24330 [Salmonella enterica subsp. enterica]|nr:hypothetical protein KCP78_24330 [Salmonella enterica subsp. enterica]